MFNVIVLGTASFTIQHSPFNIPRFPDTFSRMLRRTTILLLTLVLAAAARAQVPTPDEFLGYKIGERFTPYSRILDYFDELTRRSPLITVERFGETYEHRPLVLAVITSPKNREAL